MTVAFASTSHGGIEGIEVSVAKAAGEFRVANESIEAHLEQGSAVELVVPDLGAATPFGANLAIDTDRDVAIEYSRDRVRVGDGAILSLQAGGKPIRLRARGAHGPASAFEVVIAEVDDSPVLLARGTPADATTTNVKVQIGLSGRLLRVAAAAIGVDAASGQVSADFDGRVRLPATLQNTSGQGRFHVDVGGRTAGRRFDTAIDGGYVLDQGIRTSVDSGAHVGLNDAGIDLTTVSNATLDIGLEPLRIALGALDCKFALPPIAVGERQIVLKDAWMSLDAATFAADEFRASATLRSHAGRDAWPLRVRVSHDLATSRGTFSATGDWRAQNGAMRDELPGFDAPYDLDAGTVALTLDGRWDVSQEPTYAARGRLAVNAAQAHYEDYPIAGLSFELPIAIDPAGLSIADSRVSIASIDVGFPVTDVSLGIAVAGDVAHVRDLGGAVLGGRFAADAFDYDLNSDVANPEVSVRDVSLAEVLALEGGDVRGTGVLDGRLPIGISGDALTITDGRVTARPPGGTLIYKGAAAASMAQKSGLGVRVPGARGFPLRHSRRTRGTATRRDSRARCPLAGFQSRGRGGTCDPIQLESHREPAGAAREPACRRSHHGQSRTAVRELSRRARAALLIGCAPPCLRGRMCFEREPIAWVGFAVATCMSSACTPTVKVATDEPITINLNVNIRHEILVKVDKQLDYAIDSNSRHLLKELAMIRRVLKLRQRCCSCVPLAGFAALSLDEARAQGPRWGRLDGLFAPFRRNRAPNPGARLGRECEAARRLRGIARKTQRRRIRLASTTWVGWRRQGLRQVAARHVHPVAGADQSVDEETLATPCSAANQIARSV